MLNCEKTQIFYSTPKIHEFLIRDAKHVHWGQYSGDITLKLQSNFKCIC